MQNYNTNYYKYNYNKCFLQKVVGKKRLKLYADRHEMFDFASYVNLNVFILRLFS